MRALLLLALLTAAPSARAQGLAGPPSPPDSLAVSLLTMLPGEEVYSLFGHSAIRIRNEAVGLDRTYNFGTFDFEQPFFMARFARGQLDYVLDTAPFADELAKYHFLGRPIIEQRLALSQPAARALLRRLDENARPENRAYRYDFFFDNCSTRLLDAFDGALAEAGEGRVALAPPTGSPTFRELLRTHTRGAPTIATGMDVALGTPADRVATGREQTFLPVGLAAALDRARVDGRPFVVSRDTLFWVDGAGPVPARPEPVVPALVAVLGLAWIAAAFRPGRFERWGRRADVVLFGLSGLMGVVLAFLWLFTDHTVTGPNANLLWAFPGHLALAWAARREGLSLAWRRYAAAAALGGLLAVGVHLAGVQGLPGGALLLAALVAARAARLAAARAPGSRARAAA
ncbi:MAG TPA: DUF4105 domain-containing protein [Rubricoccaceae bacterium]|jgi:hypothetical protein